MGNPESAPGEMALADPLLRGFSAMLSRNRRRVLPLQYDRSVACVNQVGQEGVEVWRAEWDCYGGFEGDSSKDSQIGCRSR